MRANARVSNKILINRKREIFSWYEDRLKDCASLKLNKEAEWAKSIYWMTSIFLQESAKVSRDQLMKELKIASIDSRPVFPTISKYPMWHSDCFNPNATMISENSINLPSGHNLTEEEVDTVCRKILELI